MEQAREVSRRGGAARRPATAASARSTTTWCASRATPASARASSATRRTEADTVLRVAERANGWLLAKLEESPFYPEGGGQVVRHRPGRDPERPGRVVDVYRLGDDQALALEPLEGEIGPGEPAKAVVERGERLATMRNHTATHLLHAALRERARHARAPGGLLRGPGQAALRLHARPAPVATRSWPTVEGLVTAGSPPAIRCGRSRPPATRPSARRDGAVRREVRRLGADGRGRGRLARAVRRHARGRHRRAGALPSDGRDVERVQRAPHRGDHRAGERASCSASGPSACASWRALLRVPEDEVLRGGRAASRAGAASSSAAPAAGPTATTAERLVAGAGEIGGVARGRRGGRARRTPKALLAARPTPCAQKLGDAAVVLGTAVDGRVHLVANVAPELVGRGVKAGDVVHAAAQVAGGGGGGRDTMAQAGGRDPEQAAARRWRPRARRSRAPSRADAAHPRPRPRRRPAAAARSRTPPARSPRRCRPSSGPTPARGSPRIATLVGERAWSG